MHKLIKFFFYSFVLLMIVFIVAVMHLRSIIDPTAEPFDIKGMIRESIEKAMKQPES